MILSFAIGSSPANPPADSVAPSVKLELGLERTRARLNSLVVGENDQPRCDGIAVGQNDSSLSCADGLEGTHALTEFNGLGLILEE
jgi:hypothetical protein